MVCEKPCTTTQAQTKELYDLAKKQGLFFMEAEKMLFLPAVLAAKENCDLPVFVSNAYGSDMRLMTLRKSE